MKRELLNNLIANLKKEGYKHFTVNSGIIELDKFNEASGTNEASDFMDSYIIVTKVQVQGLFTVSAFTAAKKFIVLKSEFDTVDLTNAFEVDDNGVYVNVFSYFPSIHRGKLKIYYDLSTFIEPNAAKILKGSVQYIQITPQK